MTILSKLQQYNWTEANILNIKNFLKHKRIPAKMNTRQANAFIEKFKQDFKIQKTNLLYEPMNLIVVPSDDEEIKTKVLQKFVH